MKLVLFGGVAALALAAAGSAAAGADYSAAWQAQIGNTAAVQATSKGGAGITIAIVDTGAAATNPEIAGRVSALSSCAALTFTCSSGFNDDNGHGTSVASIAAGRFSATAPISMSGVAPSATILSEKVLNASGTGYDTDIANGITKAANGGAQVINLSLTYLPTTAVINAVNYATGKGAVIVWAGGNAGTALNNAVNTTGLTGTSATHIIFVGSVGATNAVSSFSNRPGTAGARIGNTTTSYASLWVMANGESIVAPAVQYGAGGYAYWTGTSMAAPEVAGAVALLEATWPVLTRNGTASAVIFATAKDLGVAGVDATYGNGLLNLTKAFQPVGALSVVQANGKSATVSSLTGAMITSGALGPLTQIRSQLSNYTAFDTFSRNFTVDLSPLIASASTSSQGAGGAGGSTTPPTTKTGFVGGLYAEVTAANRTSFADGVFTGTGALDIADRMFGARDRAVTAMTLVDARGDVASVSHGVAPAFGFAQALLGPGDDGVEPVARLGASSALMNLAQGGYASSIGASLGHGLRLAAAWSQTDQRFGTGMASDRTRSTAKASAIGLSAQIMPRWVAGVSMTQLSEDNGLLGATYDGAGLVSLGARHDSRSMAFTSTYDLGGGRTLVADAAFVDTSGFSDGAGLVRDVSALKARAWGLALVQADAFAGGDRLTVSVKKPLRVTSGFATLAVTTVDDEGYAHTAFTPVSLAPEGDETDVGLGYARTLAAGVSAGAELTVRRDAQNVRGQSDVALRIGLGARF